MSALCDRKNYYAGLNPFNLPRPEQSWLDELYAFDDRLVVVPSVLQARYQLGRRRLMTPGLGYLKTSMQNEGTWSPDTEAMISRDCIPVGLFTACDNRLIDELRERDTRTLYEDAVKRNPSLRAAEESKRTTRGDIIADELERRETLLEQRTRRAFRDDMENRGNLAKWLYRARTGAMSKRASDYHGVARMRTSSPFVTRTLPSTEPTA